MTFGRGKTEPFYTEKEYLALERPADERHQYLDGVIYEMGSESLEHGRISVNLVVELGTQLKSKPCELFTKAMKVHTKGLFSYPDL